MSFAQGHKRWGGIDSRNTQTQFGQRSTTTQVDTLLFLLYMMLIFHGLLLHLGLKTTPLIRSYPTIFALFFTNIAEVAGTYSPPYV
ncbi:MAG: hypothetical protein RPU52_11030, partial [Candidatus Sedimenticola sp. (ex Thyasira tokunagai)]